MEIPNEKIIKAIEDNLEEVLKDILTGYSSPLKEILTDEDGVFLKELRATANKLFKDVMKDPAFQERLKDKFLEIAVENMVKK